MSIEHQRVYAPAASSPAGLEIISQTGGSVHAIAVAGNYAYVAQGPRLTIVDITRPLALHVVGQSDLLPRVARDVCVDGSQAVVMLADWQDFALVGPVGLAVFDVSNPSSPKALGSLEIAGEPRGLACADERLFVAAGSSGLAIIDVTDPQLPREDAVLETPGSAGSIAVVADRGYLTLDHPGKEEGDLMVLDLSLPAHPRVLGSLAIEGTPRAVAVFKDYAYVAVGLGSWVAQVTGIRVIDVSDPAHPRQVIFFERQALPTTWRPPRIRRVYTCSSQDICIVESPRGYGYSTSQSQRLHR